MAGKLKHRTKARKERKPIATEERDDAGLLRTLRPRKPSGGRVVLAKYAIRNVAA
jgi:hypothetical protein